MSWLWQPLLAAGAQVQSVPPPEIPRGIPMGNSAWLWQPLAAAAALLDGAAIIPAYGPTVAATLILDLEGGTRVSFEWSTDVRTSWSGKQQRIRLLDAPRQRYNGRALLVDGDDRMYRATLVQHSAAGSAFLLGLPYEELSIAADSTGAVVTVNSTSLAEWLQPGQRCIVQDVDGTIPNRNGYVVQSSTPTTITLNAALSVKRGGRIMPALAVLLEPQQGLGRYVVNLTELTIAARSAEFGYAGRDEMGIGATILSYTDPVTAVVYKVWDRRDIDDQVDDSLQSMAEIVDLGGVPVGAGSALEPDWGRQVQYVGNAVEWNYLKAFLFATKGRQKTWLLPTWRPDMVYVSVGVGTLTVASSTAEGGGDVIAWFVESPAHRRVLALYADGTQSIRRITAYADNLDGTVTMTIDSNLTASPVLLCWVELVRWESDTFDVNFESSSRFSFAATARVVQQ